MAGLDDQDMEAGNFSRGPVPNKRRPALPPPPLDSKAAKELQKRKNNESMQRIMERFSQVDPESVATKETHKKVFKPVTAWDELKMINMRIQHDLDRMKEKEAQQLQRRQTRLQIQKSMINDRKEAERMISVPEIHTEMYGEGQGREIFIDIVRRVMDDNKRNKRRKGTKKKTQSSMKIKSFFDVVRNLGYAKFGDDQSEELKRTWQDVRRCRYLRGYDPPEMSVPDNTLQFVFGNERARQA